MIILETTLNNLVHKIDELHDGYSKVFVSLGNENSKAYVRLIKNTNHLKSQLMKQTQKYKKKNGLFPKWIKVDVVTGEETMTFDRVEKMLINTRRNYIDFGLVLDQQWQLAFLPEEINANAFVRPSKKDKNSKEIAENNITHYLKNYRKLNINFKVEDFRNEDVVVFQTKGYFVEGDTILELHSTDGMKGIRKIEDLHTEIDQLISTSTTFLKNEIQPNGEYIYGYFPHFDRKINYYNILRHSSSTYALTEGLSYLNEDVSIVRKPLNYIIENCLLEKEDEAYIFDKTNGINEIKLGQNAAFIFAVCEYIKMNPDENYYLKYAQKVAKGILSMINMNSMDFIHVLNYPDLSIKERFRVIYYEGETALALLRLYQVDGHSEWLETVEKIFEKFINEGYWKYHDHWLGYCTNELVKIVPKEQYYTFGIKNVANYLDFIYQRETTFPTFLELLMATYHLIQDAKRNGFEDLVRSLIDEEQLLSTIHRRADYQRTGYFYPEIAMYFKNPKRILGSFFIKHHGFRVRIDDIEHYLSGYIQYQKVFK
ncbi:poly(glycerol-phosphate) alpha-glucosyltransferase [Staphylococcus felis]